MVETLLPPNRGPFEEAASLTIAAAYEIPVDLPLIMQPHNVPEPLLPWVAWGLSVDLWRDEWPTEKKRSVTARSLMWHKIKGTRAAITEAIEIMGGEARRYVVPPAAPFSGEKLTEDEREEYLAGFAQLRVYPFVERSQETHPSAHREFMGAMFLGPISPIETRYTRTAKLWDKGEETDLTVRNVKPEKAADGTAIEYDEVILPAQPAAGIFFGEFMSPDGFFVDDGSSVRQRLVRIPRQVDYEYRLGRETYTTTLPDADLIDVRPRDIAEQHPRQAGALFFDGGPWDVIGECFQPENTAWQYLYEQWHIHDPARALAVQKMDGGAFFGHSRFGMPPYNAEVQVRINRTTYPRTYGEYVDGYFVDAVQTEIEDVRDGIVAAKSLRDKILVDTKTRALPKVGDRIKVGETKIGQYHEV